MAEIQGGIQKQPKRSPQRNAFPFLRVANVTAQGLSLEEIHAIELFDGELERYRLRRGDLLVVEGNGSASQIGRAAVWDGSIKDAVHQNHLIRVRPGCLLNERFLGLVWNSPSNRAELARIASSTSGLHTLSVTKLKRIMLPLPPVDEQCRIVDFLEDHLSRLKAAQHYLQAAERRLDPFVSTILCDLIPDERSYPANWERRTVADVGTVELGRQRHPDWHLGSNMKPYLRVANVFEGRIDTSDVMEMHWPSETFERFQLRPGDILLNEGQTPDLLGRPALYRGDPPEVAFTNSLLRFKAGTSVLPEFALLVFRRHMRAGRFKRESRITTNIAHLSANRFKRIEFPIPPLGEQLEIVEQAQERLEAAGRLRAQLEAANTRLVNLIRALLTAAFSGRLADLSAAHELVGA
nr:restriction endonuclease subunit S [Mycobacterium malmoense]